MGLDSNVKLGLIGGLVKGFRVKKGVMGGQWMIHPANTWVAVLMIFIMDEIVLFDWSKMLKFPSITFL